jgi:hypothetical protein
MNKMLIGQWSTHREEAGTPVTADAAMSGTFPVRTGVLNTAGFESIRAVVDIGGGTTPKVTIDWFSYDAELDSPGSAGAFHLLGTSTDVTPGGIVDLTTFGHRVFARVTTVSGSPTSFRIRVTPGKVSVA